MPRGCPGYLHELKTCFKEGESRSHLMAKQSGPKGTTLLQITQHLVATLGLLVPSCHLSVQMTCSSYPVGPAVTLGRKVKEEIPNQVHRGGRHPSSYPERYQMGGILQQRAGLCEVGLPGLVPQKRLGLGVKKVGVLCPILPGCWLYCLPSASKSPLPMGRNFPFGLRV